MDSLREFVFNRYRNPVFISLITVCSGLAFTPNSTITPIILNLSLLLVYSRFIFRSASFGGLHATLLCAIAVGASLSRCQASVTALSTPVQSIIVLFGSAIILSMFTLLVLYADTKFCTHFNSSWAQITLFPALWATLWCTISHISPVGHLSTWSLADNSNAYNWIVPIVGPVSKDWIIGAWAVVLSQLIGAWYMGNHDEIPLLDVQPGRQQSKGSHFQVGILALCLTIATIPSFLISQFPLPVSDISISTPLTVGCVLPPFQRYEHHVLTLDDFIHESEKIRSSARVILWPEGAVTFNTALERDEALKLVREKLPGTYIGVSFEETVNDPRDPTGKTPLRLTGVAVVSQYSPEPHLVYYKRNLVPFAESFSLSYSSTSPSIFEVELAVPKGIKKIDWAPAPNYTRSIPLTSSICLDFASHSPFSDLPSRPGLILAPAKTWERTVGYAMWLQARQRAEELQSIVLWCDGGKGGVSGVAGSGFNEVIQVGSGSFVRTIGIQHPFNHQKTPFARFGDSFLILFWFLVLAPGRVYMPTFKHTSMPFSYLWDKIHCIGGYLWQRINGASQHSSMEAPNILD